MNKKLIYVLPVIILAGIFSSCSKKMVPLSSDFFTTTPQPLEVVGSNIPVNISGNIPPKYFLKNAEISLIPVLKYEKGKITGEVFTYQGENVQGNNQTISYEKGGNINMAFSLDYKPEFASSELHLQPKAKIGKKNVDMPMIKVGEGVIATSLLASAHSATPSIAPDAFQRELKEKRNADIMFLIQQSELRTSELNKSNVKDLHKSISEAAKDENKRIVGVEVSSYASPDGGLALNEKLAAQREKNTVNYLNTELSKNAIKAPIDAHFTAQDWDGFKELVEQSNIPDKDLILRVLSMYSDPERREQEIKNISATYKNLAEDILPQLRRSRLTATIEIIGKTDDELSYWAIADPDVLTIEEMLYAASLEKIPDKQATIYHLVSQMYPNDYRAYNNLGALSFRAGNFKEASEMFSIAMNKNPNAPETNMNTGLLALVRGDVIGAQQYFGKSSGAADLNEALGVLYTMNGNYVQAVNAFGNTKSNNAAVAQIMMKDYNQAKTTLSDIPKPNALTDYLLAIVGARTNNSNMVINSLKDAIAKDPSMAKKALNDKEFYKFTQNASFLKVVK